MKKFKKLLAVMLAAVMVLAMAVPGMAADSTKTLTGNPSSTDVGKVTVSGLNVGDQVTFYQIVEAEYTANAFTGYKAVKATKESPISLFDENGAAIYPSAEQITALAANPTGLTKVGPVEATGTSVEQNLALGEWIAVVTSSGNKTVYNPMVVSVYYTGEAGKTIIGKEVNAGGAYNITGTDAYVKKSTTKLDKNIVGGGNTGVGAGKGDDLAIGDFVDFQIDSTVPAYSAEFTNPTYKIYDTMDAGLTLNDALTEGKDESKTLKVYLADTLLTKDTDYTITTSNNGFSIEFTQTFIEAQRAKTDAQRAIKVTYSAKLNDNATTNYVANKNTATVEYTRNPGEDTTKEEKKTYQYTFEIDGWINGETGTVKKYGHEVVKVNEKGEPQGKVEWVDDGEPEVLKTTGIALAGAEFKLTNTTTNKEYYAVTDENGFFKAGRLSNGTDVKGFVGLDAGTYTLVETKAPEGYSLNTNPVNVVIEASYNAEGTLKEYSITIGGDKKSTYTATYKSDKPEEIETITGERQTYYFKNTKMNNLPSTGGVGTTLFTVGGIAVMIAAAGIFFASRRKRA